jgi:hypothetical protein
MRGRGNSNSQSFDWYMGYVNGIWGLAGRALSSSDQVICS